MVPLIRAYLWRAGIRGVDLEDAVNDIITDLYLTSDENSSESAFREETISVLRSASAILKREQRRTLHGSSDAARAPADSSAEEYSTFRSHLWDWEIKALQELNGAQRSALELYEMDGVHDREIALLLGYSEKSVRALRARAKARIRHLVAAGALPPPPAETGQRTFSQRLNSRGSARPRLP